MKIYEETIEQLFQHYHSSKDGLSQEYVKENREQYGINELKEKKEISWPLVFLLQFKDLLVVILIAAAIISLISGELESTIVIFIVLLINAILGTVQTMKARKTLATLKSMSAPVATVIRQGKKEQIPSNEVVVGDLLTFEAGDIIAADARIIDTFSLMINESALTGESYAVNKISEILTGEIILGDQKNMVFSSTLVTGGRGRAIVTSTGMNTEIGKIANLLDQTEERKTPLQESMDDFSKKLSIGIIIISFLVFGLNVFNGANVLDALMFAVALAVAAIPEALSSIVTIVLALGTKKLAEQKAIVKELRSVESLGSVSIICSDKTGTLTQNKMKVVGYSIDQENYDYTHIKTKSTAFKLLEQACVLCNDGVIREGTRIGDPTELALLDFVYNTNTDLYQNRNAYERLSEVPFDSERKLMSTLNKIENNTRMFVKGAADELILRSTQYLVNDEVHQVDDKFKKYILKTIENYASNGERVLGFAYKDTSGSLLNLESENNVTFIGLISMIDPPREETKEAINSCLQAGIKPIMITGDHKVTAMNIAKQIGIYKDGDLVIDGNELNNMSEEELDSKINNISVYARVAPEHKIRIVDHFERHGEIVAMTGDGVNDAPALKKADIGIAMGITGTQVSKDAASMILVDDNFSTIVSAVMLGRNIYENLRNSIKYLLSGNFSGILVVLFATVFALPNPFLPVQLLFINLVTDSLPAIAIGVEKSNPHVIKEKPRTRDEGILTKNIILEIIFEGICIGIATMFMYFYGLQSSPLYATTLAFSTLCLARLFHGFNCRNKAPIHVVGLFSNKFSIYAFVLGFILLNAILLFPALHSSFGVQDLSMVELFMIYGVAFAPTVVIQIGKSILYYMKKN